MDLCLLASRSGEGKEGAEFNAVRKKTKLEHPAATQEPQGHSTLAAVTALSLPASASWSALEACSKLYPSLKEEEKSSSQVISYTFAEN